MNSSHRGKPEQITEAYYRGRASTTFFSIEAMVRAHGFQGMVMLASYRERVKGAEHGALWLY
ncbi:MAG: hypothetical protein JRI84_12070 [Deltaproteobacteria bacterium]|nr:hypothetical protein [Deltaproteobacteria bacterium]